MKKLLLLSTTLFALGLMPAFAQFGGHAQHGPNFGGGMDKIFGEHKTFSATMEFQTSGNGNDITMPGKFSYDTGKTRFEMNMSESRGTRMSPQAAQQMKAMGMDSMISIGRPDLKLNYLVYPGLNSYAAMTPQDPAANTTADDYKADIEKIGADTVGGHDCVKNKVTVTDKEGNKHVSTVWNATDLKDFPIKIVTVDEGTTATMLFKNLSFDKPSATSFEPPTGYTKYDNVQTMMQTEMMKHMGGMGMPGMPHGN